MPFIVQCPACRKSMRVPDELTGHEVQCPSCQEIFHPQPPAQGIAPAPERPAPERPAPRETWQHDEIRPGRPSGPDGGFRGDYDDDLEQGRRFPQYSDYTPRALGDALPGGGLTLAVCILFGVLAIIHIALLLHHTSTLRLLERAAIGPAEADEHDRRAGMLALVSIAGLTVLVIVYCVWIHRMYSNLYLFGAEGLYYSPGWAVGGWFVPFLNLVRPVQVMQEIWRASSPAVPPGDPTAWQGESLSPRVGFWWAVYLLSGIFGTFAALNQNQAIEARDLLALKSATTTLIAAEIMSLVAVAFAVSVVVGVYGRQKQKFLQLTQFA